MLTSLFREITRKKVFGNIVTGAAAALIMDGADSLIKNQFCDIVTPRRGSLLRVDLAGRPFATDDLCHTGIYLGNNRVAEVTSDDHTGEALVRIISTRDFLCGDFPSPRTGLYIYTACGKNSKGRCFALGSEEAAQRAEKLSGSKRGKYNILFNNCHMFCYYCLSGIDARSSFSVSSVESLLSRKNGRSEILWRSTGVGKINDKVFKS